MEALQRTLEESSAHGESRGARVAPTRRCEACREHVSFFDAARAPCGHNHCRECLNALFDAALRDESLFPPRCCRALIPTHLVKVFLRSGVVTSFDKRTQELETPIEPTAHRLDARRGYL